MSKFKLLSSVCAAAIALGATPAMASGPHEGDHHHHHRQFYVSGFGGWAWALDHEFAFVSNATGTNFGYRISHDQGYTVGGAIGIVHNPNVRFELELSHSRFRYGDDYRSTPPGFVGLGETGSMRLTTLLANVWFNANFGNLSPYIGGGVGVGWASGSLRITNGAGAQFSGDDQGIAFQAGAGIRYAFSKNIELDLGYRLKHVPDMNFASSIAGFTTTDDDITTHAVQLGINFKF